VEGGSFLIPRTFTMDGTGHFYIDDGGKHRIARFSFAGTYEMEFRYLPTAGQIFAHADSRENLWLLISDPAEGMYYGVYGPQGKRMNGGIFSKFNHFNLHLDDQGTLHVLLTSQGNPSALQTYFLDEKSLLMKREMIARPPEDHHELRRSNHRYFTDQVPGSGQGDHRPVTRITDESHRGIASIQGSVIYVTGRGDIYTRVGPREIRVYDLDGSLKGKVTLTGLTSACSAIRFDADGSLYELDGIPDKTDAQIRQEGLSAGPNGDFEDLHYTPVMPGMRLIQWERR